MPDPFVTETTAGMLLLGRYQVQRELGRGGFGVVVQALDVHVKRLVAIKTLHRPESNDDYEEYAYKKERFSYEAEAMAAIGVHPQIVTFFTDVIDADEVRYLILEYLAGGSLEKRITQEVARRTAALQRIDPTRTEADVTQGLEMAEALRITAEAARGLQAAHDADIVHRDMKPQNIFLTADGRAKVGDFGIAQIGDRSGRSRLIYGHPGSLLYMSPEQQKAALGYLRPASDQYSLGLTLFAMLTGKEYRRIGERERHRLLESFPGPVVGLFERMTQEDEDARFPSMKELVTAIERIDLVTRPAKPPDYDVDPPTVEHGPPPPLPKQKQRPAPNADAQGTALHTPPPVHTPPAPPYVPPVSYDPPPAFVPPAPPPYVPPVDYNPPPTGGYHPPPYYPPQPPAAPVRRVGCVGTFFRLAVTALVVLIFLSAVSPSFRVGLARNASQIRDSIQTRTVPPTATAFVSGNTGLSGGPTGFPMLPPSVMARPITPTPITPTPITPTVPRSVTVAPPVTVPAPPLGSAFTTWTDPRGLVTLRYPSSWRVVQTMEARNVLRVIGPDRVQFDLSIDDPQSGTIDQEIAFSRTYRSMQSQYAFMFDPVQDVRIGGEPAKLLPSTYRDKTDPNTTTGSLKDWVVNHGGREFTLTAGPISTHGAEVDAIIASVTFLK